MRFVVGYTSTPAGRDAVALGARLARVNKAKLDLVVVLGNADRVTLAPADKGYTRVLEQNAEEWLAEAAAQVPNSVAVRRHTVFAESFAEGLEQAAEDLGAAAIVIGAARGGILGRFTIGSTANTLLHSSTTPVALAPDGYRAIDPLSAIARVTCAIGNLDAADALIAAAVESARAAGVPLRFLSLAALDLPGSVPDAVLADVSAARFDPVIMAARDSLGVLADVSAVVASGHTAEQAVRSVTWDPAEIVFVGASRLAAAGRIFLGATAAKMLRELPTPMIVVPRDLDAEPKGSR
ncbi:universal stress protein [Microbacteriaceae bacterium VKM Ac-2855]|nr:universal stress protein [Microbacteriaceae bacterium VKM Ac-2855]